MPDDFIIRLSYPNQKLLTNYTVPYHFAHLPHTRRHGTIAGMQDYNLYRHLELSNRDLFHLFSDQFGHGIPKICRDVPGTYKPSRRYRRGEFIKFDHLKFDYSVDADYLESSLREQVAALENHGGSGAIIWEISRRRSNEMIACDPSLKDQLVRILLEDHRVTVAKELRRKELDRHREASLGARHPEVERKRIMEKRRLETPQMTSKFWIRLLAMRESEMMLRENQQMAQENRLVIMHDVYLDEQVQLEKTRQAAVESMMQLQQLRIEEENAQQKNSAQKEVSSRRLANVRKSHYELVERMSNWVYLHQTIVESLEIDGDYYRSRLQTVNYHLREIESRSSEGIRSLKDLLSQEFRLNQEIEDCTKELKILDITINFLNSGGSNFRSSVKESTEEIAALNQTFDRLTQRYSSVQRNRRECESGLQRLCILRHQKLGEKESTLDNIRGLLQYKIELIESVYPFSLLFGRRRSISITCSRPKFSSRKSNSQSHRRTITHVAESFDRLSSITPRGPLLANHGSYLVRNHRSVEADTETETSDSTQHQSLLRIMEIKDDSPSASKEEPIVEEEDLNTFRNIYEDIVRLQDLLRDDSYAFPDRISLSDIIRKKPFFIRTDQERQWIAVDYRIHRELYETISEDERTLIETHPSFFYKISEQRLGDLESISSVLSEAVGEIETAQEWHIYLVNQEVSQGRSDQSRQYDDCSASIESQEFSELYSHYMQQLDGIRKRKVIDEEKVLFTVLDGIIHPELYSCPYTSDRFSFSRQEMLNALYNDYSALSSKEREAVELYNKFNPSYIHSQIDQNVQRSSVIMKNITDLESILLQNKTIFSPRRSCILLDETSSYRRLYVAEMYEHRLILPLDVLYSSFTITIKYHGESRGQYFPGRLSALFNFNSDSVQIPIGYSSISDIQLNTAEKEGFIIIHHHPKQIPLLPGIYILRLRSFSRVYYTVQIAAEIIDPLKATLHRTESEISEVVSSMQHQQKEIRLYKNILNLLKEKRSVCSEVIHELDSELNELLVLPNIDIDRHEPYYENLLEIERQYQQKDSLAILIQTVGDKLKSIKASCIVSKERLSFFQHTLPHCYEIMKVPLPEILKQVNCKLSIDLEDYKSILCPLTDEETQLCPLADESDPLANHAELRLCLRTIISPPFRRKHAKCSSIIFRFRSNSNSVAPYCDTAEVTKKLKSLSKRTDPCLYEYYEDKLDIENLNQSLQKESRFYRSSDAVLRRDRLLMRQVSYEMFQHALDEMYTGWHFGEVQKLDNTLRGSVPKSLVSVSSLSDLIRAESLDNEERTLKFGLFAVTMQFFRSMHFLKKMKRAFSSKDPIGSAEFRAPIDRPESPKFIPPANLHPSFMIPLHSKSKVSLREKYAKQRAAIVIQRHVRGWLTRILYHEYTRISSANLVNISLRLAAAISIQRHWRGCQVRKKHYFIRKSIVPMSMRFSSPSSEIPLSIKDQKIQLPQVYRKKGVFRREIVKKPNWLDSQDLDISQETMNKLFEFAFS